MILDDRRWFALAELRRHFWHLSRKGKRPAPEKRTGVRPRLRFEVLKRDGFRCQYCGAEPAKKDLHIDHILPVAKGGGDEIENLTTACADCNLGKGARAITDPESSTTQEGQPTRR